MASTDGHNLRGAVTAVTGIMGRAVNQVIVLVVTLLAARWLTPTLFGVYAISAALVTLSRTLLYAGAFEYLLKAKPGEEAATECLVINVVLSLAVTALLAGLSVFTADIFHSAKIGTLLLWMAPSTIISAAAAWQESQLLRSKRVRTYYGVTTVAELVSAVVTVAMILLNYALIALIVQIYVRAVFTVIAYRVLQRPLWSESFSFERLIHAGRWSSARYGTTMVNFLSNYSVDILLGAFLSPAATGLYRASNRIVTGVGDLVSNPTRMMAVTIFSSRAASGEESGEVWPKIVAASTFIGWTALAGMAAISAQVVPVVLGAKWAGAAPIVAIVCVKRALGLVDGVSTALLVAYGHARVLFLTQMVGAVAGIAALIVLARFGVAAAAFSTIPVGLAYTVFCAWLAAKASPGFAVGLKRMAPVALGPPLAAGLAAWAVGGAIGGFRLAPWQALSIEIGAGVVGWALISLAARTRIIEALHALNATGDQRLPAMESLA